MMVYSVAPVSCAVELHSHLLLFTSDVSTIGAADSRVLSLLVGDLRTRGHGKLELSSGDGTLYQIAAKAHTLPGATFRFGNRRPKCFGRQQGGKQGLRCAVHVTVPHCTRAAE